MPRAAASACCLQPFARRSISHASARFPMQWAAKVMATLPVLACSIGLVGTVLRAVVRRTGISGSLGSGGACL